MKVQGPFKKLIAPNFISPLATDYNNSAQIFQSILKFCQRINLRMKNREHERTAV